MDIGTIVRANADYGVVELILPNNSVKVVFGDEWRVFKSVWPLKSLTEVEIDEIESKENIIFLLQYVIKELNDNLKLF